MTLPNVGVHNLYEQSDQYNYMHKCNKCGFWNIMDYKEYDSSNIYAGGNVLTVNPDGVDKLAKTVAEGSFQYVCRSCGKPLDRWDSVGEWVPRYPSRNLDGKGVRGYLISQLDAVWLSADDIKRKELNSGSKQSFNNYVLGKPYEDEQLSVSPSDIYQHNYDSMNFKENREGYRFVAAGIDWGNQHTLVVMGMTNNGDLELLNIAEIKKPSPTDVAGMGSDMEKIKLFLEPYDPDIIVADIGDSGDKIAQLMKIYGKDKVWGCRYKSSPRSSGQLIPTWSDSNNTVTVDKLMQNKRFINKMKEGQVRFPKNRANRELQDYIYQWQNVKIMTEEDERTGDFYQVITRSGPDHKAQSSIYGMLGIERLQDVYFGDNTYGFDTTSIELGTANPTLPDIYNQ